MGAQGGNRRERAGAHSVDSAERAVRFTRRERLRRPTPFGDALSVWGPSGEEMTASVTSAQSDALVFFGATGDLAHKKVFPALQAMVKRGHLNVPIVGVAKANWNLEQLRARTRESVETHGGGVDAAAFDRLSSLLRYVDGDYRDSANVRSVASGAGCCRASLALPGHSSELVLDRCLRARALRLRARRTRGRGEAVRP